jgi:hypothetical protein
MIAPALPYSAGHLLCREDSPPGVEKGKRAAREKAGTSTARLPFPSHAPTRPGERKADPRSGGHLLPGARRSARRPSAAATWARVRNGRKSLRNHSATERDRAPGRRGMERKRGRGVGRGGDVPWTGGVSFGLTEMIGGSRKR